MEAIKIKKIIDSPDLHIEELRQFIGLEAEIVILPLSRKKNNPMKSIMKLAGVLKLGRDPLVFQRQMRKEWEN